MAQDKKSASYGLKLESAPESHANDRQVGGGHYKKLGIEVWDISVLNDFDPFQHSILRYLSRWYEKGGIQDLEKIIHFTEKYIELAKRGYRDPNATPEIREQLRQYVLSLYTHS